MANELVTKVVTGTVRLSYANIWEPKSINEGEKKFSVSLLIPKTDKETLRKIKAATEAAKEAGKSSKFNGKIPANLKTPLRDGDEERPDDETYAGHYFLNATSTNKPQIFDLSRKPIEDEEEVYSGCYGRVSINLYPFNVNGNRGIAAGLNGIQKVKDGPALGGRGNVAADFDDDFMPEFDDDDDDFMS